MKQVVLADSALLPVRALGLSDNFSDPTSSIVLGHSLVVQF